MQSLPSKDKVVTAAPTITIWYNRTMLHVEWLIEYESSWYWIKTELHMGNIIDDIISSLQSGSNIWTAFACWCVWDTWLVGEISNSVVLALRRIWIYMVGNEIVYGNDDVTHVKLNKTLSPVSIQRPSFPGLGIRMLKIIWCSTCGFLYW